MEKNISDQRSESVLSPWVTLVTHDVRFPGSQKTEAYHAFKQADYVTLFAVTSDGRIPLIRQYRPALSQFTLELPSGMLDAGETPITCAVRELFEETGLKPGPKVEPIGHLVVDSGRLENKLWAFFSDNVSPKTAADWKRDPQLECRFVTKNELKELILKGQFEHAPHLAVMAMALARGCFSF